MTQDHAQPDHARGKLVVLAILGLGLLLALTGFLLRRSIPAKAPLRPATAPAQTLPAVPG